MTPEEKQLLLKDLCARLPYGVKCAIFDNKLPFGPSHGKYPFEMDAISIEENEIDVWLEKGNFNIETIKPYLRPMSSMTEEEKEKFLEEIHKDFLLAKEYVIKHYDITKSTSGFNKQDWLNANHFDYRGLIEKGLAIEAPNGMYKNE